MDNDHQVSAYDRIYDSLHNSQFPHTKPQTFKAVDFLGRSETFITETVHTDDGDVVFVEYFGEGHQRLRLPQKVVAALYRNRETLINRSRKAKAKAAMKERMAKGFVPTFAKKETA